MAVDPKPDIRSTREVGHFIDGQAQVAVRKVKAGRGCCLLVSGNVELRQIRATGEKRLQHPARNIAARGDPENVLVGEDDNGIALAAVLLEVTDAGLERPGEGCRIADATEFPEAAGTFRQRVLHLRQPVTEARW